MIQWTSGRKLFLVLRLLIVLLLGWANAPSANAQIQETTPIPPEHREAISLVEKLGHEIYEHDRAAWVATDIILARFPEVLTRVDGWIVVPDDVASGWHVYFIRSDDDREIYAYQVSLDDEFRSKEIHRYPPSQFLSADHLAMYRARQLASDSTELMCTTNYNTVVLSASLIGETGWLVYLLPASTVPGEQYLGHHRVLVDTAGTSILRNEALSNRCLRTPPPPPDAVVGAITHRISQTPIEIHVLRSLMTDLPIAVLTPRDSSGVEANLWSITKGTVAFHGPLK